MKQIRKISVGDNLKDAIHYQVSDKSKICNIIKEGEYFDIYTKEGVEIQLWKSFQNRVVCHIEYVLD